MNHSANQQKSTLPPQKRSFRKKRWFIGAIAVLIIAAVGVTAWALLSHKQAGPSTSSGKASQAKAKAAQSKEVTAVSDSAQKAANNGDTAAALKAYDDAIKKTSDPYQKSILLIGKATVSLNAHQYDVALASAKEADAISQDANTTHVIAEIYRAKGDTKNAIVYFTKSIALIDKSSPRASSQASYYQSIIDALKKAQK